MRQRHMELVADFLKSKGLVIDERDDVGRTPLFRAIRNNNLRLMHFLLIAGADANAMDRWKETPLHWAAFYKCLEEAELLLGCGANVNARNYEGKTPLAFAIDQCNHTMVELLKKHGGTI